MKETSLRQSIFRVILGGIIITAALVLFNVWAGTAQLANDQIERDLVIAENVFQRVLDGRKEEKLGNGKLVTDDFGFKDTIASRDVPTIDTMFQNHGQRAESDFMFVTELNGNVITSVPALFEAGAPFPDEKLIDSVSRQRSSYGFIKVNDILYQLTLFQVRAPRPIAYTGIGFAIDDDFLKQVEQVVQADIIVYSDDQSKRVVQSSLEHGIAQNLVDKGDSALEWRDLFTSTGQKYGLRTLNVEGFENAGLTVALASDLTPIYNSAKNLQLNVLSISIVAIVLLSGVALLLSRRVSQPLDILVDAVGRISKGQYDEQIHVKGRIREISHLASAFDTMKENIKNREERIRFQAQHDMLTGLYNRNHIEQVISRRLMSGSPLQVIGINIIGFRTINDLYGYANGDRCLKCLAERLTRWGGEAARLSGGEIIWLSDVMNQEHQLETLRHILEQPVEIDGINIPIKVVMAEIHCPEDAKTTEEVFRKLNILIDEGQAQNQWLMGYKEDFEKRYLRRLSIITELKQALSMEQSELSMVYQPKLDLKTMKVMGVEALLRWNSAALGFVPPDEFIAIAEQAGLIDQVTLFVVQSTVADLLIMRQNGYDIGAAINLSSRDIQNKELLEKVQKILSEASLSPSDVSFEITESDLVEDAALAVENLNHLKSLGFKLAIDDFGTGYSSMAYLKTLPAETIKIDKSFVLNLVSDNEDQQIVHTVLSLAKIFNLTVVAEGIEDEEALKLLADWGCDYGQGYFISRPLKLEDFMTWLTDSDYYVSVAQSSGSIEMSSDPTH